MPSKSLRAVLTTPALRTAAGCYADVDVHVDLQVTGRVLDVEPVPGRRQLSQLGADAARQEQRGGHAHRAEHADRMVRQHRDERAGADRAAVTRRATRVVFGTLSPATSPRPISLPAASRSVLDPLGQSGVPGEVLVRLVAR